MTLSATVRRGLLLFGLVDGAHAAFAEHAKDAVAAQSGGQGVHSPVQRPAASHRFGRVKRRWEVQRWRVARSRIAVVGQGWILR